MQRSGLEHIIRASGDIAGDHEIIIIGSQAILGQFPDAPARLLMSMAADIFPKNKPEMADLVDGSIGEGSSFHEMYGYYVRGVGPQAAVLPKGWQSRLVSIKNENTDGISGLCLEVHDLAISKLVAHRKKDLEFIQELVKYDLIKKSVILDRLKKTELPGSARKVIQSRIQSLF